MPHLQICVCLHLNGVRACSAVQKSGATLPAYVKLSGMGSSETKVSVKTTILIFFQQESSQRRKKSALWCLIDWAFWQAR